MRYVKAYPWSRRPGRPDRRRSRAAVAWLLLLFALSQLAGAWLLESGAPALRDPEYYRKLDRLLARRAEHPGRPLVVALGSSRVGMGLCPAALENYPAAGEPLLFNFGVIGGGPVLQEITLRRLLRDGARPDAVVAEFWPAYFVEHDGQREEDRIDPNRLGRADLDLISPYARDPSRFPAHWRRARLAPAYDHRFVFINLVLPSWVGWLNRQDFRWTPLDAWGWKPGADGPTTPEHRGPRVALARQHYASDLASRTLDPTAVRAFDDLLGLCRREGIPAAAVWMPESSEFRSWYAPHNEAWARRAFAGLRARFGVRLIDARRWSPDADLHDGFHLNPAGAAAFTERLRREALPALLTPAE